MSQKPRIFVIILNWNQPELTIDCLNSVWKSGGRDLRILLVDNASTDGSVEKIKKGTVGVQFDTIVNETNLGFAGGNNVGIRYALKKGADYIFILNNDTLVGSALFNRTVELVQKDASVGLVSPKIYFAKGFEYHKGKYKSGEVGRVIWYAGGKIDRDNGYGTARGVDEVDRGQYNKVEETDFATGTCMLITKQALQKAGLFDERYYMYYEDTDFSLRVKEQGFKVMFNPDIFIWHKVAQSSGIGSDLNDYFISRNRMLFGMRFLPMRTKFALFRESIKLLLNGRKWQKIGIRDYYLGRFGRGSWK